MVFIRRLLRLVKMSAWQLEGLKYTPETGARTGPGLISSVSRFHPCFLALIKILIPWTPSPTVILESFKSRVSVLDMVQVALVLLESNHSLAVRGNGSVWCARGHIWRMAGGIPKYLLENVTSCLSLSSAFFLMCSVTSCGCNLTPSGQTAILLLQWGPCSSPHHSLLLHEGRKPVEAWDGTNLGRVLGAFAVQLSQQRKVQIQFIPEPACDVQRWISRLLLLPSSDVGHRDKKPMHFFVLSEHISSVFLWGRGNGNSLNLQRFKNQVLPLEP